jgi:hypothetical protein
VNPEQPDEAGLQAPRYGSLGGGAAREPHERPHAAATVSQIYDPARLDVSSCVRTRKDRQRGRSRARDGHRSPTEREAPTPQPQDSDQPLVAADDVAGLAERFSAIPLRASQLKAIPRGHSDAAFGDPRRPPWPAGERSGDGEMPALDRLEVA